MPNTTECPECHEPTDQHVGRKDCLPATTKTPKGLHDLPIFGWAWQEDGRDRRA